MEKEILKLVRAYVDDNLDPLEKWYDYEVYVVWYCYILGNRKWLVSTTIPDDMYYEVTYNQEKGEVYLDAYKKEENICYDMNVVTKE